MEVSTGTFIIMMVNFIVMMVVLVYLLYKPIRNVLQERENKIRTDLDEAQKSRESFERMEKDIKSSLQKAQAEASETIEKARREAEKVRAEILAKARQEAQQIQEKNVAEIELAKQTALNELREGTVTLALLAAEKVIGNQMSEGINEALVQKALQAIEKGGANNVLPGNA